mgnify:CR=1 FL=1
MCSSDLETDIKRIESEKEALRHEELKSLEWKPLWGIPAIFAAVVLLLFTLFFKERAKAAQ